MRSVIRKKIELHPNTMAAISLPLAKLKDIISVLEYIHPSSRSFSVWITLQAHEACASGAN